MTSGRPAAEQDEEDDMEAQLKNLPAKLTEHFDLFAESSSGEEDAMEDDDGMSRAGAGSFDEEMDAAEIDAEARQEVEAAVAGSSDAAIAHGAQFARGS